MTGWALRVFGREVLALHRDQPDAVTPPVDAPLQQRPVMEGGAGHNFDRRGEVDYEAPAFGFRTGRKP